MSTVLRPDTEVGSPEGHPLELPDSGEIERLVLARGNLFAVLNRCGDIAPSGARDLGLFYLDTRHLSHFELRIADSSPVCLSSETADVVLNQIDLTLTDHPFGGLVDEPQNVLHIRRKQILDGELVEQLTLTNHLRHALKVSFAFYFAADFADIFEVRGARRACRGEYLPARVEPAQLQLGYRGRDGEFYRTLFRFLPAPSHLGESVARFHVTLEPGEASMQEISIAPLRGSESLTDRRHFDVRLAAVQQNARAFAAGATGFDVDNEIVKSALSRALGDLDALRVSIGEDFIIGAGIPWFSAPFGRDAIWTSLETLAVAPQLAYETLHMLARYQGVRDDPSREEQPGKIMHELRRGEMARASEIPHSPYYGTVDATPLYCILLGETFRQSADAGLLEAIFPFAERALGWVERELDRGGGFLRYERTAPRGLDNQGWKDSPDGVSFPNGERARPPIALIEVQGYAVAALEEMAELYALRGRRERAVELRQRARALRERIEKAFWVEEARFYALALDGSNRQVPTLSSNPGHLLWARAVSPSRAHRIAEVLTGDALFSGWGIRTIGRGQAVFNPLAYHNGTVWPHDNAIAALGMARYGMREEPLAVFSSLFAAARHFRYYRLPELFCGMARSAGEFLVHYPVSCSPQAWAAGALFMFVQAVLGLEPHAASARLDIVNPRLPDFVRRLDLIGLPVGNAKVTLRFMRERDGARCHVDLVEIVGGPLRIQVDL